MNVLGAAGSLIQPNADPSFESETELYGRLETELAANLLTADNSSSTNLSLGDDENNTDTGVTAGPSSRLSISNKPQHELAPDLSDLRKSQDLHNRLQVASSGLAEINSNLQQLSETVSQPAPDNQTTGNLLSNIESTLQNTTYNNEPLFTASEPEAPAQAESIQQAIMVSKNNLTQSDGGEYLTAGNETFILANSRSETLFSFAPQTPLEEVNETLSDYTADAGIHPLFYVEDQIVGSPQVINSGAAGTAVAQTDLTLTPIDGELFSRPIYEENPANARVTSSTMSVRLVEDDNNIAQSENITQNNISGTINLAEDKVEGGLDIENMRQSNHALTRSINFNNVLDDNKRQGDGFAVTPVKEEPPVPPHVIEQENREILTAVEGNKDNPGTNTTNNTDVLMMPPRDLTPPPPPQAYVTLQEREFGITGDEALYQTDKIFLSAVQSKHTELGYNQESTQPAPESSLLGSPTVVSPLTGTEQSFTDNNGNPQNNENQQQSNTPRDNIEETLNPITAAAINAGNENYKELNITETNTTSAAQPEDKRTTAQNPTENQNSITAEEAAAGTDDPLLNPTTTLTELELAAAEIDTTEAEQPATGAETADATENTAESNSANNPQNDLNRTTSTAARPAGTATELLQNVNGVITDNLNFTLTGKLGSLDFVIRAGNTNQTVALAVNKTQNITGVSATTSPQGVDLSGELSGQFNQLQSNATYAAAAEAIAATPQNLSAQAAAQPAQNQNNGSEQRASLSELGRTEQNGNIYSLDSLQQLLSAQTNDTAEETQALPSEIIDNALSEVDALQNNLQSLSSLNQRNVENISQQVNEKLLPESARPLTAASRPADIAQALNLVAVGINNSTSAAGGTGFGSDPLASLHLLSPTPAVSDNRSEPLQQQNLDNIQSNPTAFELANMQALSSYNINETDTTESHLAPATAVSEEANTTQERPSFFEVSSELSAGREELKRIQETIRNNSSMFDNHVAGVQDAADNFFTRIENTKLTIREAGREFEAAETVDTLQKERFAETAYDLKESTDKQAENNAEEGVIFTAADQLRLDSQEFSKKDFSELLENIGNALGNSITEYSPAETPQEILNLQQQQLQQAAPASPAFSGATDSSPVATTQAASSGNSMTAQTGETSYKSLNTIINGKLGNVMVHGQGYTLTDLHENGWQTEDATDNAEVADSVLEKAISELTMAESISDELAAGELLDKGDSINGAINAYGSDLSATTPAVAAAAANIRSMSRG